MSILGVNRTATLWLIAGVLVTRAIAGTSSVILSTSLLNPSTEPRLPLTIVTALALSLQLGALAETILGAIAVRAAIRGWMRPRGGVPFVDALAIVAVGQAW